jgi:hypothetical protein
MDQLGLSPNGLSLSLSELVSAYHSLSPMLLSLRTTSSWPESNWPVCDWSNRTQASERGCELFDIFSGSNMALPTRTSQTNVIYLSGYSADLLQDFLNMLGRGRFEDRHAEAEPDPCAEGKAQTGFSCCLSSDQLLRAIEESSMYASYKLVA